MIVILWHWREWVLANRVWLASLTVSVAINGALIWLASLAPSGSLPAIERIGRAFPIAIAIRRPPPPPPGPAALTASESPPSTMPPRFNPKRVVARATPNFRRDRERPMLRLQLKLDPCDPANDDVVARPDCASPREWLRADRDAASLLGPDTQGYALDEVAVARGWLRRKPRSGQDAMAAKTDATHPEQIFKDPPFPPHAIERTGGW